MYSFVKPQLIKKIESLRRKKAALSGSDACPEAIGEAVMAQESVEATKPGSKGRKKIQRDPRPEPLRDDHKKSASPDVTRKMKAIFNRSLVKAREVRLTPRLIALFFFVDTVPYSQLDEKGEFHEALKAYKDAMDALPADADSKRRKVGLIRPFDGPLSMGIDMCQLDFHIRPHSQA